jgi:hypothetical protein
MFHLGLDDGDGHCPELNQASVGLEEFDVGPKYPTTTLSAAA